MTERCFACDRKLGKAPQLVSCKDEQTCHVGIECYRLIKAAGADGYQPPKGGPRLYLLQYVENPFVYEPSKMFPFCRDPRRTTG